MHKFFYDGPFEAMDPEGVDSGEEDQKAQPGMFKHYRRRKTNKAPRKRTFIANMTKYPDILTSTLESSARGLGAGGGGLYSGQAGWSANHSQISATSTGGDADAAGLGLLPSGVSTLVPTNSTGSSRGTSPFAIAYEQAQLSALSSFGTYPSTAGDFSMVQAAAPAAPQQVTYHFPSPVQGGAAAAMPAWPAPTPSPFDFPASLVPEPAATTVYTRAVTTQVPLPPSTFPMNDFSGFALEQEPPAKLPRVYSTSGSSQISSGSVAMMPGQQQGTLQSGPRYGSVSPVSAGSVSSTNTNGTSALLVNAPAPGSIAAAAGGRTVGPLSQLTGVKRSADGSVASLTRQGSSESDADVVLELTKPQAQPSTDAASLLGPDWRRMELPFKLQLSGLGKGPDSNDSAEQYLEVTQMVNEGAYGMVYLAKWGSKQVAVKLARTPGKAEELSAEDVARSFNVEAAAQRELGMHPNIVSLLHAQGPSIVMDTNVVVCMMTAMASGSLKGDGGASGSHSAPACLVQEFAALGSLSTYITSTHAPQGPQPLERAVLARLCSRIGLNTDSLINELDIRSLGSQVGAGRAGAGTVPTNVRQLRRYVVLMCLLRDVALALSHLAERKMVHRDVKPSNVLVTAEGAAQLADFGVARRPPQAPASMPNVTGAALGNNSAASSAASSTNNLPVPQSPTVVAPIVPAPWGQPQHRPQQVQPQQQQPPLRYAGAFAGPSNAAVASMLPVVAPVVMPRTLPQQQQAPLVLPGGMMHPGHTSIAAAAGSHHQQQMHPMLGSALTTQQQQYASLALMGATNLQPGATSMLTRSVSAPVESNLAAAIRPAMPPTVLAPAQRSTQSQPQQQGTDLWDLFSAWTADQAAGRAQLQQRLNQLGPIEPSPATQSLMMEMRDESLPNAPSVLMGASPMGMTSVAGDLEQEDVVDELMHDLFGHQADAGDCTMAQQQMQMQQAAQFGGIPRVVAAPAGPQLMGPPSALQQQQAQMQMRMVNSAASGFMFPGPLQAKPPQLVLAASGLRGGAAALNAISTVGPQAHAQQGMAPLASQASGVPDEDSVTEEWLDSLFEEAPQQMPTRASPSTASSAPLVEQSSLAAPPAAPEAPKVVDPLAQHDLQGTPHYAAPEDLAPGNAAASVTPAADVFSLGYCIWEALTGQRPWEGNAPASVVYCVGRQGARLPIPNHWPVRLQALVRRCWQADPALRPAASEVATVLEDEIRHIVRKWD